MRESRRGGASWGLGMLEWFQAAFPEMGGEKEQPQAAAGSVWELGEQAMLEAGAARVGRRAGMQDLSRMDGKEERNQPGSAGGKWLPG